MAFFFPIKTTLAILWKQKLVSDAGWYAQMPFQPFFFFSRIWWKWKVRIIYRGDLWSQMHRMLFIASTVQQRPDRLNSIMAVWCVETPEVRANSSVYTPESLSQTKTNTFIGFQDLVCCDCPIAFEVSHRFMLFTYSCSFFPSNHHGVFR